MVVSGDSLDIKQMFKTSPSSRGRALFGGGDDPSGVLSNIL